MINAVFGLLSCLIAVQVRYVIGESFYHVGPEQAEEELQEGIHSYACIMYSPVPSIPLFFWEFSTA